MHWTRYVAESQNVELHDMAWEFLLDDTKISTLNMILRCLGSGDASAHEYRYNNCALFVGASALHLTSFSGSTAIVSRLFDSGIDPNVADSAGLTPLMYASLQGHDEVVRLLLEAGADECIACLHNSTALHRAAFHGCENVIEALLRQKTIDINLREGCSGFTPLSSAIFQGLVNIMTQLLVRKDLLLNEDPPALSWAAYVGDARIVKVIMDHSAAQLELRDVCGRTALLNATRKRDNVEVVRVLLKAGANLEVRDNAGYTPLFEAMKNSHVSIVGELLGHKPELMNGFDGVGANLIHTATQIGGSEMLRFLLENPRGSDINAQDTGGRTALHYAALQDLPLAAEELLEFGARTDIKDEFGYTPIEAASQSMHTMTYRILLEAGIISTGRPVTTLTRIEMHMLRPRAAESNTDQSQRSNGVSISKDTGCKPSVATRVCHTVFLIPYDENPFTCVDSEVNSELLDGGDQRRSAVKRVFETGDLGMVQALADAGVDKSNYEDSIERHQYGTVSLKATEGLVHISELLIKHVYGERTEDTDQLVSQPATLLGQSKNWTVGLFLVSFSKTGLWKTNESKM